MKALLNRIADCDSHHRLIIAGIASLLTVLLTTGRVHHAVQIVAAWNTFSAVVMAMVWIRIALGKPEKYLASAKLQDSSRTVIFLSVIVAACMSLFAVTYLLGTAKGLAKSGLTLHVLLAVFTVAGSWCLLHTIFTLRYAHTYYGDSDDPNEPGHAGGLDFPEEENPDYLDFAYFAFVIGMTCQVSDVQITGRGLRRLALVHGLLSFAFNTVILALSLNIVSGLLAG